MSAPVEIDKVTEIVKAGMHAPSAGDLQNWKFIVITNPDVIKSMYNYTMEQDAFLTATVAIIVCAEVKIAEEYYGLRGSKLYSVQSCAAAIQNMSLAAHSLGLGSVWIGAFDEEKTIHVFGIPPDYRPQAIVLMGYPDETPRKKVVKDVWWNTYFMKFGNKFSTPHRITRDLSIEWEQQINNAKRIAGGLREEYEIDDKIAQVKENAKAKFEEIKSGDKEGKEKSGNKSSNKSVLKKPVKKKKTSFLQGLKKSPRRK